MAKWMPPSSRPGTARSRGTPAPPASTMASITVAQVLVGDVVADVHAALELHALAGHEVDAPVDHPFLQFEVGYAVAQQSARFRVLLVDGHVVARPVEYLGGGQPRGTGTHHGHSLGPAHPARLGR